MSQLEILDREPRQGKHAGPRIELAVETIARNG
jgi:hypothetical protein